MCAEFLPLAQYLWDPLVSIGLFLLIAFSISRILVKRVIPPLPKTLGFRILRLILLYGFIIGLFIITFGFLLKRQELIGQQRTAENIESILKEVIKGAPGSDEKKSELISQIVEAIRRGDLTKEQAEKKVEEIKVFLTQTNNYPPEYQLSRNQSNSEWQQRSHSTLPASSNSLETKTSSLASTTSAIDATGTTREPSGASPSREISSLPTLEGRRIVVQNPYVPCLICQCQSGDTSQNVIEKAWDALNANKGGINPKNFEKALACTKVIVDNWGNEADEQQARRLQASECKKIPTREEKEKDAYFASYWALSDVAAAWWIRGQVLEQQRNCTEAKEAYGIIIAKYNCACIWDPKGYFWNAVKGAERALKHLETRECSEKVR